MFDDSNRGPELVWNLNLLWLNALAQPRLESRTTDAEPSVSGSDDGKMWATTASATGSSWADNKTRLAVYSDDIGWRFKDIKPGIYYVIDSADWWKFDGSAWTAAAI
jgi:hypothetical protein